MNRRWPFLLLLSGLALSGAATAPAALGAQAEGKPSTPEQDLIDFRAGVYDGCIKGQKALGKPEKYQEAFCTCLLSVVGEIPEAELKVFMQRVAADLSAATDPAFAEKLQHLGATDCVLVGQFDDTKTLSKEEISRLGEPKVLDAFSIRLPRGFMAIPVQQQGPARLFAFGRLHADLVTSTVIQVTLIETGEPPPTEPTAKDRQQLLGLFLKGIKARRTEWTQSEPSEVELGGLPFATVDWTGKTDGKGMQGTLYATIAGNRIVTLGAQDLQPFAADTIPLAKEVFRTFSLR